MGKMEERERKKKKKKNNHNRRRRKRRRKKRSNRKVYETKTEPKRRESETVLQDRVKLMFNGFTVD